MDMNSRVSMDCAILMVPDHADWMSQFVRECAPSGDRFRLHCVALDGTPWQPDTGPASTADALRTCAMALRRYDVCLLPVTLSTLGWTRMALAVAEGVIDTPMVGITRDMTAAGLTTCCRWAWPTSCARQCAWKNSRYAWRNWRAPRAAPRLPTAAAPRPTNSSRPNSTPPKTRRQPTSY
jgi:hypothetical protein